MLRGVMRLYGGRDDLEIDGQCVSDLFAFWVDSKCPGRASDVESVADEALILGLGESVESAGVGAARLFETESGGIDGL